MPEEIGASWRALHVYYYEQADELLLNCLDPITGQLRASGEVTASFFLRYWMGGPHVRWRVRVGPAVADDVMKLLWSTADDYLQRRPSCLKFDTRAFIDGARRLAAHEGEQAPEELVPDNSLRPAKYHPEYAKYGGPCGMRIAEELFDASSTIALRVLRDLGVNPSRRLGSGYLMLLAGARAAGLEGPSLVDFLARYCRFWGRYVPDELSAGWPEGLARQRSALRPVTEAALGRRADGEGWQQPAGKWMAAVHRAWAQIDQQREDVLAGVAIAGAAAPIQDRRTVLLLNHLHTHHNRLGLLPAQEAYLAFLAHHLVHAALGHSGEGELGETLLQKGDKQ